MENVDETFNEKPKGNMLQNENREDEPPSENLTTENEPKANKQGENVAPQPTHTNIHTSKDKGEDINK